eukprot:TRINITY_DN22160_c0_g1_i1.p1 TRINITY_DN22160_c0_g1~~TRINITY_DN22160_c0_g1_i1.p1  ORF type:complete len:234 (+),score=56.92 TRINITY_DN22160_c0_g1_i1:116-817(+)
MTKLRDLVLATTCLADGFREAAAGSSPSSAAVPAVVTNEILSEGPALLSEDAGSSMVRREHVTGGGLKSAVVSAGGVGVDVDMEESIHLSEAVLTPLVLQPPTQLLEAETSIARGGWDLSHMAGFATALVSSLLYFAVIAIRCGGFLQELRPKAPLEDLLSDIHSEVALGGQGSSVVPRRAVKTAFRTLCCPERHGGCLPSQKGHSEGGCGPSRLVKQISVAAHAGHAGLCLA